MLKPMFSLTKLTSYSRIKESANKEKEQIKKKNGYVKLGSS